MYFFDYDETYTYIYIYIYVYFSQGPLRMKSMLPKRVHVGKIFEWLRNGRSKLLQSMAQDACHARCFSIAPAIWSVAVCVCRNALVIQDGGHMQTYNRNSNGYV